MPPLPQAKARQSRAERRETIRRRVFDAVERLLATETFSELTIDRIIGAAEISRSTFYFHFVDKATLLLALSEDVFATAAETAAPWWNTDPADMTQRRLLAHLRRIFALYVEHEAVLRALVDTAGYEPLVRQRLAEMPGAYIDRLEAHLVRGQNEGVVRATLRPRESASWVVWMLERGQYQLVAAAESSSQFAELAEAAADVIFHALYRNA